MPQPDARRRDLAKIHIGAKELGLSRADYECLLWTVARVKSSSELDAHGRRKVLQHMRSRGFKPRSKGRTKPAPERELMVAKIRALLINAKDGARPDSYADAMAQRMFQVERFEWCNPDQLRKLIQALEVDKRRRS